MSRENTAHGKAPTVGALVFSGGAISRITIGWQPPSFIRDFRYKHNFFSDATSDIIPDEFLDFPVGQVIRFALAVDGKKQHGGLGDFHKGQYPCTARFPFVFGRDGQTDFMDVVAGRSSDGRVF